MNELAKKKITKATLKSFVKKNKENLFIKVKSTFDGMSDGIVCINEGFKKVSLKEDYQEHTLGIEGAWLVGSSRDYFNFYSDRSFEGIEVYNCCGSFIIATKNEEVA